MLCFCKTQIKYVGLVLVLQSTIPINNKYYLNTIIIILSFSTDALRILVILHYYLPFVFIISYKNYILFYSIMWRNHVVSNPLEAGSKIILWHPHWIFLVCRVWGITIYYTSSSFTRKQRIGTYTRVSRSPFTRSTRTFNWGISFVM